MWRLTLLSTWRTKCAEGKGREVIVAPRSSMLYTWDPLKHSAFQHVIHSLGQVISETQVWRNAPRFFKKPCFLIVPLRVDIIKLNKKKKLLCSALDIWSVLWSQSGYCSLRTGSTFFFFYNTVSAWQKGIYYKGFLIYCLIPISITS